MPNASQMRAKLSVADCVRWLPGKLAGEIDVIPFQAYSCEKWRYIRLLPAATVIGAVIFGSIVLRKFGAGGRPDLWGKAECGDHHKNPELRNHFVFR
jgi:hypothetical protein